MDRFSMVHDVATRLDTQASLTEEDKILEERSILPTIGAEIEILWKTVLPNHSYWFGNESYLEFSPEKKKEFDQLCTQLEKQIKHKYTSLRDLIPADTDAFYEFAHHPTKHHKTLSEEITLLMNANLIKVGYENPLHVTISDVRKDRHAGVLTFLIEFLGGTTSKRIASAFYRSERPSGWQRKGRDTGFRERKRKELSLGKAYGIEIATLCAINPQQVQQTLRNAQILGWAASSTQKGESGYQVKMWNDISEYVTESFLKPYDLNRWMPNPREDETPWRRYMNLLDIPHHSRIKTALTQRIDELETQYKKERKS